ncbi:MAG: hypothetical protein EBV21_09270 [Betaproteobacteria bacterium]|nr:hypothetical protein [Betaproteobacteria bacterium]
MTLDITSLTAVLIRHFNIHEGVYQLNVGFKIGVGGFALDPTPTATPLPGAAIGVEGFSLVRIPEGTHAPNMVDAAKVNPAHQTPSRARARKPVKG